MTDEQLDLLDLNEIEDNSALAGFSDERDDYGREVLERNFANLLTMSKNSVKRNYSALKNAAFAYVSVKSVYDGETEILKSGKDVILRFSIDIDTLFVSLALPKTSIDKKVYPFKAVPATETEKALDICVSVNNKPSLSRAKELISVLADTKGLKRSAAGKMVAYAELFPVNAGAVLKGKEDEPPIEGCYDGEEYEDIKNEIRTAIEDEKGIKRKTDATGKEELEFRRQTATTVKGAVALQEPIVYYYDVAVDKEDKPIFVNVRQVLNDKFLGKLVPEQYFAVAEGSERIEGFNFLAIEEALGDAARYPSYVFAVETSVRLLLKTDTLKRLKKYISSSSGNVALVLDCALLEAAGEQAKVAVKELRLEGAKIVMDNSEQAGMRALTDFDYEYLRFDARYYETDGKKEQAHLQMLSGYAKTIGIQTVAAKVETVKQAINYLTKGVSGVEGFIIQDPKRIVQTALKERKRLPTIRG